MQSFLLTAAESRTSVPIVATAPQSQVPPVADSAAALAPKSRIALAASAVDRMQGSLDAVLAPGALVSHSGFAWLVGRAPSAAFAFAMASAAGACSTFLVAGLQPRFLIPTVLLGGLSAALFRQVSKNEKAESHANGRALDTKDLSATLDVVRQASSVERELMRSHVEQQVAVLERNKRLTPKASSALRKAVESTTASSPEVQRAAALVGFARDAAYCGTPSLAGLAALLAAMSPEERSAAADYLEGAVFPNEVPPTHVNADYARDLYRMIETARSGEGQDYSTSHNPR